MRFIVSLESGSLHVLFQEFLRALQLTVGTRVARAAGLVPAPTAARSISAVARSIAAAVQQRCRQRSLHLLRAHGSRGRGGGGGNRAASRVTAASTASLVSSVEQVVCVGRGEAGEG